MIFQKLPIAISGKKSTLSRRNSCVIQTDVLIYSIDCNFGPQVYSTGSTVIVIISLSVHPPLSWSVIIYIRNSLLVSFDFFCIELEHH